MTLKKAESACETSNDVSSVKDRIKALIEKSSTLLDIWQSDENKLKGIALLNEAIELGSYKALFLLGEEYENGGCLAQDLTKAKELYMQSAQNQCQEAVNKLIHIYYHDEDDKEHYARAMSIINQYAIYDNGYAYYMKGWMYLYGQGVTSNTETAIRYLGYSAGFGKYLPSIKLLEEFFEYGHQPDVDKWDFVYIQQDLIKAAIYHEKGAKLGDKESQYKAAICKLEGRGTSKDYHGAFLWLWESSLQNYGLAQVELAKLYTSERLFPKDVKSSLLWLLISQNNIVSEEAQVLINEYEKKVTKVQLMKLQKEAIRLIKVINAEKKMNSEYMLDPHKYLEINGYGNDDDLTQSPDEDTKEEDVENNDHKSSNNQAASPLAKWNVQNAKDIKIILNLGDHNKTIVIEHLNKNKQRYKLTEIFSKNMLRLLMQYNTFEKEGTGYISYNGKDVAEKSRKNHQIVSDFNTEFRKLLGRIGDRDFKAFEWIGKTKSERSLKSHIKIEVYR